MLKMSMPALSSAPRLRSSATFCVCQGSAHMGHVRALGPRGAASQMRSCLAARLWRVWATRSGGMPARASWPGLRLGFRAHLLAGVDEDEGVLAGGLFVRGGHAARKLLARLDHVLEEGVQQVLDLCKCAPRASAMQARAFRPRSHIPSAAALPSGSEGHGGARLETRSGWQG